MAVFQVEGDQLIRKVVKPHGKSGRVYLEGKYTGQEIIIILPQIPPGDEIENDQKEAEDDR